MLDFRTLLLSDMCKIPDLSHPVNHFSFDTIGRVRSNIPEISSPARLYNRSSHSYDQQKKLQARYTDLDWQFGQFFFHLICAHRRNVKDILT